MRLFFYRTTSTYHLVHTTQPMVLEWQKKYSVKIIVPMSMQSPHIFVELVLTFLWTWEPEGIEKSLELYEINHFAQIVHYRLCIKNRLSLTEPEYKDSFRARPEPMRQLPRAVSLTLDWTQIGSVMVLDWRHITHCGRLMTAMSSLDINHLQHVRLML